MAKTPSWTEQVKKIIDVIGMERFNEILREVRKEYTGEEVIVLRQAIEAYKANIKLLESDKERLTGEINGLKFAIRCNGINGGEAR